MSAVIAFALAETARRNDRAAADTAGGLAVPITPFDFPPDEVPSLPLRDYVLRIMTHTRTSPDVYVVALMYIDKLGGSSGVAPARANAYRMFAAATTVAYKFLDDRNRNNRHLAVIGGVPLTEFNAIEATFLMLSAFSLAVDLDEFAVYRATVAALASHFRTSSSLSGGFAVLRKRLRAV
jgi:hypothetical protein